MEDERAAGRPGPEKRLVTVGALREPEQIVAALFGNPNVGVAICDKRFRYQAINECLAAMNGMPRAAHMGRTLSDVMGNAAAQVQPAFEDVFSTGKSANFEVAAELPNRKEMGYWILNYFPIKDKAGKVKQVCGIVVEVTKRRKLEESLRHLTGKLVDASSIRKDNAASVPQPNGGTDQILELAARSIEMLESSIAEARRVSELLRPALLTKAPLLEPSARGCAPGGVHHLSARERQVVQRLAEGMSNKEIAAVLEISARTVETYRARVMLKLDLHSIGELVRYAVRNEIIVA
jgi:DNA-binding CsgD family transcriptional regulator